MSGFPPLQGVRPLRGVPAGTVDGEPHPEWGERELFGYADWLLEQLLDAQQQQTRAIAQLAQAVATLTGATGGVAPAGGPGAPGLVSALGTALAGALGQGEPPAEVSGWTAAKGSTDTEVRVVLQGPLGVAANLSAQVASDLAGARLVWLSGQNVGNYRNVSSVTTGGALTLDEPLPNFPQIGDLFALIRTQHGSLAADSDASFAPVVVGLAAVRLDTGLAGRRAIAIVNNGAAAIYLGVGKTAAAAAAVTTGTGLPVAAPGSAQLNLGPDLFVYGISGTAGQDVRVLEVA